MEFGETIKGALARKSLKMSIDELKKNLSAKLRKIHQLGIALRDIKPENILYFQQLKDFRFIDFGISHSVAKDYRYKTTPPTSGGTLVYMTEELKNALEEKGAVANMLLNDVYALKKSFEDLM